MYRIAVDDKMSHAQIIEEIEINAVSKRLVKNKDCRRDKMIFTGKEDAAQVFYLEKGCMGTFVNMGREGQQVIDFHKQGDLIGFEELLLSQPKRKNTYHYSFERCSIKMIDGSFLLDYLSIRPVFMEYFMKCMAEKNYQLVMKEGGRGKYQKDKAIIGLLEAAYKLGAREAGFYQFPSSISNLTLANYCRIDPTSFSKICKRLFEEKFILDKKKMLIDLEEMRAFLAISKGFYL